MPPPPTAAAAATATAGQQIRMRGRNLTENDHVKLGAYHTLELDLQRPFVLAKGEWDAVDAERVRAACDPAASADLAVLLITVSRKMGGITGRDGGPRREGGATTGGREALS